MSNWNERERKIFKLKLGEAVTALDPMRCILNFNRAVRDLGGRVKFNEAWVAANKKPRTDISEEEAQAEDLAWAEARLWLAQVGAATVGMKLYTVEEPEGLTMDEAAEALFQYAGYVEKKDSGAESSPTLATPVSAPQSGETSGENSATETTSQLSSLPM